MTQFPTSNRKKLEQKHETGVQTHATSASTTCKESSQQQEEQVKQSMVTPKGTSYLSNYGEPSPKETKWPPRVLSCQSLLGLVGLEGHEESESEMSTTGISAVTEEQDLIDNITAPSTPKFSSEGQGIEDATCNTTPPGSVQGPGILSLSPPRLTTYSVGSATSASVTDHFGFQPRPVQCVQRQNYSPLASPRFSRSPLAQQNHAPQESPRFSRSPLVQHNHAPQESSRFSRSPLVQQPQLQPQPKPRSRPPRAPHHPSTIPGGNNSAGGGHILAPRAVIGTGPESSGTGVSGSGHTRTHTDATNYSFLSSLTDVSGEFCAPRRRTLSWDNHGITKSGGPAMETKSLGGPSTLGGIMQPILLPDEMESTTRPPMSISASNLRKVSPAVPGPITTTPTPPSSSRKTSSTSLFAPLSLPSRENLHPLIKKLQNTSHTMNTPFMPSAALLSSPDENNLPLLIQRPQYSSPSESVRTSSTYATSVHPEDEKKDDDSSRYNQMIQPKPLLDRKTSDCSLFCSSFSSSTTNGFHKKTTAPLIQKLQNASHTKNTPFMPSVSLLSSPDEKNLHPLIQRLQYSSPAKSTRTASTYSTSVHRENEKKDDDSSRYHQIMQQKPLLGRTISDHTSFSSSFSSSTTIGLQKKTTVFTGNARGAFERQKTSPQRISEGSATCDLKHTGCTRYDLGDILDATKECDVETDIVEGIERNDLFGKCNENYSNDRTSLHNWPYFLLAWGILNLGGSGLILDASAEVKNVFVCDEFIQFCVGLGAVALLKRKLSKMLFDWQVMVHYRDELSKLRNVLVILNEIVALSTKEEEYNSDAAAKHVLRFRSVGQHIDRIANENFSSSFGGLGTTRENFIESSQIVYERLAKRDCQAELNFETLCELLSLRDGFRDQSKVRVLSELFCPSRQGPVSKFDFVKSTDSIYKTTVLLIANINNASQICCAVDHIANVIVYSIALILAPSIFGADINTLMLTLLGVSVNFTFMIYLTSAENLKGILRLITQKSYDVGDRISFIKPEDTETKVDDGSPSGGWIVEKIDLYKTTVRQGITGERSTFANGCDLLTNSRVVNRKRSHRANVTLSMEFSGKTGRVLIDFFRRQISEWIEDRPREWVHLDSFRMVDVDIKQQRVKYDVVLRHRESWHNYAAVQDSKSEILIFLQELRNNVEA